MEKPSKLDSSTNLALADHDLRVACIHEYAHLFMARHYASTAE